jgi:hypothetical protein
MPVDSHSKQIELFRPPQGRKSYVPALSCAAGGLVLCFISWLILGIYAYWDKTSPN